ncbi:hypothetical protein [Helicobacter sp. T3_23-1056]
MLFIIAMSLGYKSKFCKKARFVAIYTSLSAMEGEFLDSAFFAVLASKCDFVKSRICVGIYFYSTLYIATQF